MPLLDEEPGPVNPFATPAGAKPEGLIVTRDDFSPPVKEGGPAWSDPMGQPDFARPSFGQTLGASFRMENEVVGAINAMKADRDFGDPDPEHNPWDSIKGTKYQDYWQAFVPSRNAKETEYLRLKLDQELEDRRLREAAGVTGFATDMIAAIASPTTLIPGGAIYKGYRTGLMAWKSAASVGAMAAASVTAQELMLQQQQLTRTFMESALNVGGGVVLGGLLGGGASAFANRALVRASRQIDADIARINQERAGIDAPRNPDEPPFGQPVGAQVTRPIQENVPESAFGLEKVFAFQGPMPRVMGGTIKSARDVMSRLAEMTGPLKQNKEGIPSGPAGGSVELRIKVDGDLALYRAQEGLYKSFAEYRFGNRDAPMARTRAAFSDLSKPVPGRMDFRTYKSEVTKALRSQTEKGIEHPVPQVKQAAETIRAEIFEPFKKEAIKLGLFPKEAEFDWNYVMRRWDVSAILNDLPRFRQILFDHIKGGQAKAAADLDKLLSQLDAADRAGDVAPEVDSLARQFEAERQRFAVDNAAVNAILDMWRLVVKERPKKPLSLTAWLRRNGGLRDEGSALAHMLGGKREAGRLIRKDGALLDDAALRAFEKGYFPERPTISEFLDAIDDDIRSGGTRFSAADAADAETWRLAQEYRDEIAKMGLDGIRNEKQARRKIAQALREQARDPDGAAAREADEAFKAELAKMEPDTPEAKAAVEDAQLDLETRMADEDAAAKRRGGEGLDPVFAAGVPTSLVRRIVESGRTYRFADETIAQNLETAAPFQSALPEGVQMGTWASVGPGSAPGLVSVVIRTAGGDVPFEAPAGIIWNMRAGYIHESALVIPNGVGERLDVSGYVASGIYHEAGHAHLRQVDGATLDVLVSHAEALRVLDMQFGTFLRVIGHPTWENAPNVTLREQYARLYKNYPPAVQVRAMAEEAVTHMQELHYAGFLTDTDVAPVLGQLLAMRGGAPSRAEGFTALDMPVAALKADAATGQSMARSLDNLGYYSQALEAVNRWGQNKGTPEQFLAWLKKSGVKDAEIEALGLKARLEGSETVTKQDMVDYIGENREELSERSMGRAPPRTASQTLADEQRLEQLYAEMELLSDNGQMLDRFGERTARYEALVDEADAIEERMAGDAEGEIAGDTVYHGYSLDPQNPTYRETVLHLPEERYGDMGVGGHFPEPNIIGHMMTSLTLKGDARVFTVDQIQSDWGQRMRDRGPVEPERLERVRVERNELRVKLDELVGRAMDFLPRETPYRMYMDSAGHVARMAADDLRLHYAKQEQQWLRRVTGIGGGDKNMLTLADEIDRVASEHTRVMGEYRTLINRVPAHPLINTTDQWVNTTLRRAVRQAIEADAEYIAIPTGDTVLSYNPGDTAGMRGFYGAKGASAEEIAEARADIERKQAAVVESERYDVDGGPYVQRPYATDERFALSVAEQRLARLEGTKDQAGIVPKNLRNILQKIDKSIVPEFVETLDSPSGKTNLGRGFTIFPLTDKVRQSVMTDGLPMFAVHGGDEPRMQLDPRFVETANKLGERLGVKMPDLSTMDIDSAMAAMERAIKGMTGRAEGAAKLSEADRQKILTETESLRFLAGAADQELFDIVDDTISKLRGSPVARQINPYDPIFAADGPQGKSGPLQARTLKIPDSKVVDFLDDDIERIALHYVRAMEPDVAIAREFGDLNLTEDMKRVKEEGQQRINAAQTPAERIRIDKETKRTEKDIQAVVARLRGTLNQADDPTAYGPRAAMAVKQANILRLMGAVLAASISDPAKLLFVHGFRHNFDLFSTLITDFQGARLAKAEAKEMSAGLEFVLSRSGQMWDSFEDLAAGITMPEKALRYATNKMGRVNLMDAWNSTLKQLSGIMTANRILRASVDLANGRISPTDLRKLGSSGGGIDPQLAVVIAQQYQKHGGVHGRLFLANANAWDQTPEAQMARRALQAAVRHEADLTIVTPGQEKPLWTSKTYGSMVGQFRTFQMSSIQRTLIAGLQEADAAKLVALSGMIAMGILAEQLKIIIHGKEQKRGPQDMGEWLYAGLANSGALGWLTDADQTMHKISGGNVSLARHVFGNERPISRFASQNAVGALLGPTYGMATDLGRTTSAALSGKSVTEGDVHAMRRLIPYQNLFYISRSLRAFEEGMIDAAGIPRQQRK